jgi:hypothetical protein
MQSLLHGKRLTIISFEKDRQNTTAKLSLSLSVCFLCAVLAVVLRDSRGWNDGDGGVGSNQDCARQERQQTMEAAAKTARKNVRKQTRGHRRRWRRGWRPLWFWRPRVFVDWVLLFSRLLLRPQPLLRSNFPSIATVLNGNPPPALPPKSLTPLGPCVHSTSYLRNLG